MLTQGFKNIIDRNRAIAQKYFDVMLDNGPVQRQERFRILQEPMVRLIALLNDFVDYHMNQEKDAETAFPVFYMPTAEAWARDVAVEFLMLKMSLTYNSMRYRFLQKQLDDISKKRKLKSKEFKEKKFLNNVWALHDERAVGEDRHHKKNIFVGNVRRLSQYAEELVRDLDGVNLNERNHYNLFKSSFETNFISEAHKFKKNTGFDLQIENMFLFFGESFNREASNLNRPVFDVLRQEGCIVRNVFVFRFSERPYQASKIWLWKTIAGRTFLQADNAAIKKEKKFVSFAKDELDYVFCRDCEKQHVFIEDVFADEDLLEEYLSSSEHPLIEKNELSLCFNKVLYEKYCLKYSRMPNDEIFRNLSSFWRDSIFPKITDFISENECIAVVVNNDTFVAELKDELQKRLSRPFSLKRYDIKDLKRRKCGTVFLNNVNETKVLVFQYWKHDLQSQWTIYPNSFDCYFENLVDGQKVCEFINGNILGGAYKWHLYGYNRRLDQILSSDYRRKVMNDSGGDWKAPEPIVDDEMSPNDYAGTTRQIRILYANSDRQTVSPSTYFLYECGSQRYVDRIDAIKDKECVSIQPLDEFARELASLIDEKERSSSDEEREFRKRIPNLTESERQSPVELWKILLKKFVEECGKDEYGVYQEMKRDVSNIVSFGRFQQWIDLESDFILPRNKSHQRYLFDLLGLPKIYLRLVRRRKASMKRATGSFNRLMDSFLKVILVDDVDDSMLLELSENDIFDLLNLESIEDLRALQQMLRGKINLSNVRSIDYA
jgi:hypothetical protein